MNLRWAALLLTLVCLNRGALAQAGPGADNVTLQSLLTEVRQLRLAVERVTSVWPQTQLVLQRMQIQQQHVELLSRQLEQLRDQIAKSAAEAARIAGDIKQNQSRVSQEQDARRRQDLEDGIRRAKAYIEQQASMITSKPAIHDHFKTGQRTSTRDTNLFYLAGYCSGKLPRFMVTAQTQPEPLPPC